jgi:hypothetical protein
MESARASLFRGEKTVLDLVRVQQQRNEGCCSTAFATLAELCQFSAGTDLLAGAYGLSGGVAGLGIGSCGPISAMAIGVSYVVFAESLLDETNKRALVRDVVSRIARDFATKHGGLTCHEVHRSVYGRTYDFHNPADMVQFRPVARCDEVIASVVVPARDAIEELRAGFRRSRRGPRDPGEERFGTT